jgi:GT2 family glycosyltransferase
MRPHISVVIPARNEGPRLAATIDSFASARTTDARVEVIIADDQSEDDTEGAVRAAWRELSRHPRLDVHIGRLDERHGVPGSRNHGARLANGEILFITDAHVCVSTGWDELLFRYIDADRVLAGVVTNPEHTFAGYGCRLVVPFMGTYWNHTPTDKPVEVQIAACPATALTRELFDRIGGYDDGMVIYGAAEPEFSVRAWLYGAQVVLIPDLRVTHRFKPKSEARHFIRSIREHIVCNGLRFGLMYLDEPGAMQHLRYYALKFPNVFEVAAARVADSDVWLRRKELHANFVRPFSWFVDHFGVTDQFGGPLP